MTGQAHFGIWLAFFGTLVLTFDAMLMRLSEMSGLQMTAWRGLCMGTVLILLWLTQSRTYRQDLRHMTTRAGVTIIACQFFNSLLFCFAIAIAPVAVVLFGLAAVPVFAAIFAWLIIGEHTPAATWVTIVLVIAGIGIAVSGKAEGAVQFDLAALAGAGLGLGVAVVLALNFVTLRARPELPIALLIGCGALISGVMSVLVIGPQAMMQGWIPPMIATGAVVLPLSFFSLSLASRYTLASNVSLLMLLETVLGPFWVWLVIGEAPTSRMLLGGMIVIVSLAGYLILTGRRGASPA
ncbi:DMT family transporter [uncultured Roseovarius sp.]|uniref:DMT family transporter n=1 Tax=uncultured Roseovarius sp. TaxID=293344 RepID=UPI00261EE376|nr:DMT family transporter [uncultured Roseovarius sp.]